MGLALVAFDTDRIKDYVFATGSLRDIRGASSILDRLNRDVMPTLVGGQCAYSFGGSGLFAIPSELAEQTITRVQRAYADATAGAATITGVTVPLPDGFDLDTGDIQPFWRLLGYKLMAAKTRTPAARVALGHPLFHYDDVDSAYYATQYDREASDLLIGPANAAKRQRNREIRADGRDGHTPPEDFEAIARDSRPSGYFALLVADGNGIGRVLDRCRTFAEISKVAGAIFGVIQEVLREATAALAADQFDVLLLGGDDLVLAVPAQWALDCALTLSREFARRAREHMQVELSLSVAIVWAHTRFPFATWHELADSALKFAKHEGARRDIAEGLINFLAVSNPNHVTFQEYYHDTLTMREERQRVFRTLRPYTADSLEQLLHLAGEVRTVPRTKLEALYRAVFQPSLRTAMLDARHLLVHWRGDTTRAAIYRCVGDLAGAGRTAIQFPFAARYEPDPASNEQLTIYTTPLVDLAELWDFLPESA